MKSSNLTAFRLPPTSLSGGASRRLGFSLLELLVAITVLIVIVMVTSLIFQQASAAWGTGTRKAGAETALRSVIGAVERDLAMAVDDTPFGGHINSFSANSCTFVTLNGAVASDGTSRMPQRITYSYGGGNVTRTVSKGAWSSLSGSWSFTVLPPSSTLGGGLLTKFDVSVGAAAPANDPAPSLPLRVDIEAHATKYGQFAIVSGWSEGRNQQSTNDMITASL